ncbi:superoxide dismutase family protein [Shewanella sp. SNU WT4]|uniref:superoxide dismutase family protein n=1 Tax=Shewanella sp. SNU WT4 TaxID=2590015 RepID=UPI00112B62DC|nr:superoxide dismutase family protein [Shewanella sp. SNU WT4]QDF68105.1 superoxide dismutase family protein [Shewanella sp. SNU WT4]
MNKMLVIGTLVSSLGFSAAHAADVSVVDMALLSADGNQAIGEIVISETDYGLVFTPNLKGLSSGQHGFHVHANGSCDPSTKEGKTVLGGAAGGHFDPDNTGKHGYPWTKDNHKGDLPSLSVNADGTATTPVLAPRLTASDIKGKAIMVHIGGDNHSDHPAPLGGGGARMACGVAK